MKELTILVLVTLLAIGGVLLTRPSDTTYTLQYGNQKASTWEWELEDNTWKCMLIPKWGPLFYTDTAFLLGKFTDKKLALETIESYLETSVPKNDDPNSGLYIFGWSQSGNLYDLEDYAGYTKIGTIESEFQSIFCTSR